MQRSRRSVDTGPIADGRHSKCSMILLQAALLAGG